MREKTTFWTYLVVLAVGIALIVLHNDICILNWLVTIVGLMFALPGLIGVISALVRNARHSTVSGLSVTSSIGSLVFGTIMIVWPGPFVAVFVYILATVLIVSGLWQIWSLAIEARRSSMPVWLYLLPTLVTATGIVMLCTSLREIQAVFTLMAGIGMVACAANGFFILMVPYNNNKVTV